MHRVFVGLLAICILLLAVPLMAADSPMGMELASFQALDNAQLDQIRGQGWEGRPDGFRHFFDPPYPQGVVNAYLQKGINSGENTNALKSRVFYYVNSIIIE